MEKKYLPRTKKGRRHGNVIYNRNFKCVRCHNVIGEYNDKNKQRVVRAWVSLCYKCYKLARFRHKRC